MMRKLLLFSISIFLSVCISAQTTSVISGSVRDTSSHSSVKNAVVMLLSPRDSVLKAFTRVNEDGSWSMQNVPEGKYIISVSHPLFGEYVDDVEIKSAEEKIPAISVTAKSKLLEQVLVKSKSTMRVKGDTTFYTADSFKVSANANVEELLKKMPGIQVDKDGKITAMGQTVEKVLVDGEEFFGDDPGMATKNLRADAVKEVQVFDKKSDQAEFSGVDDGKTQKTINLKLKEDKKKGYFGKADLAGGLRKDIDSRYNNNLMFSSFKGKRKLSAFFLTGNTGQSGLNWDDRQKYDNDNSSIQMDDDGNTFFTRGSNDDEPYINSQNGYMTNVNAGVQYSNKWNDKTSLNFSPKYNKQIYNNNTTEYTQTQLGDSAINNNNSSSNHVNRENEKFRAVYEYKIDSNNTVKLTANANFYRTESNTNSTGETSVDNGKLKNSFLRNTLLRSDKQGYSANILFKHKFRKLRRTLSVTADVNSLNTAGKTYLRSINTVYSTGITTDIDQMKDFERTTATVSSKLVYTEPLGKKYSLELAYQISLNHGSNDQITYAPAAGVPGKYDVPVDSLSNLFRQNIVQHIPSARLNYSYKKLKINAGAGMSFSDFNLKDLSFGKQYERNYSNFSPSANVQYSYKSNKSVRFNYNGQTRQPTLDQLQPLRNNNDQFNQYLGNPDLKPSFSNNFSLSHNAYNFLKDTYMYQSLNFNTVSSQITNSRYINIANGTSVSQPINMNGNYSMNFYGGVGFKLKKIDTRLNINANGGFNRNADLLNFQKNTSKSSYTGLNLGLSKSKEKKYDVSLWSGFNYNVQTTSQNTSKLRYVSGDLNVYATLWYKKVWSLSSDYSLDVTQKTAQAPGFSANVINARLERTFKKDEFTFYLTVRDLLNQNVGNNQYFTQSTFSQTRNDRLQRYWMLGFTWNFKNKAPKAENTEPK